MNDNIRLDPKHGLNPTMTTCFYCGKPKDILLVGKANKKMRESEYCNSDGQMNYNIGCIDKEPCNECASYMEAGIMLISTKDGENGENPYYRTGKIVVVHDSFIEKITDEPLRSDILKARMCFMEDKVWNTLGLNSIYEEENE